MVDITDDSIFCFLQKYGDNWIKREFLFFWISHPNTKFSKKAIGYNLTSSNLDVEATLNTMVEEGLINKNISNGVALYSLTLNQERRRLITELANLGWYRWQPMLASHKFTSSVAGKSSNISQVASAVS
jgi:hypothetical protein